MEKAYLSESQGGACGYARQDDLSDSPSVQGRPSDITDTSLSLIEFPGVTESCSIQKARSREQGEVNESLMAYKTNALPKY